MSELIAEARVLVTPDTTGFRALLLAETTAIAKTIPPVPVQITPVVSGGGNAAALAGQTAALSKAERDAANAIDGGTEAKKRAIPVNSAYAKSVGGISSGAASAGLSLVGLRGATLAATGPFLAGAAGAIALGKSLGLATSFNSEIAVLGATTGATGVQLTQAAEAAREFGRDITLPGVTAGDAAKTITEFSKAGLDLNESIAATRGGLQLAQAAQLSYTDAVTLTANALNAFNLSGDQAVRVADTLANASNLAQGGIGDTALALRQAASAAEVVGVSFEDTTALLTLLARNGLSGSDAGTALRTAFLRLVNPSKEANAILKSLNVNLRDIQGNIRPEAFAEFAQAQKDLSVATQQANAAIVFGQDAFRAIGILGSEGAEGLTEVQIALRKTGTAAELAQARMVGLAGATENLSNQVSALGEQAGQVATPGVEALVNQLADGIAIAGEFANAIGDINDAFNDLPGPSTSDFADDLFGGLKRGLINLNPQVAEIFKFGEAIRNAQESSEDEIKNGGVGLRDALETAGREASRGAVSFADQITGAIKDAFALVEQTMRQANQSARAAALREVGRSQGQAAGLEEQFDALVAGGGGVQQQRAQLVRQAQVQANIIESAGTDAAGVQLEARRRAQAQLASINQQIAAIDAQIVADQKSANDERTRLQEEAKRDRDAAFLQSQDDARSRQERSVTIAGDTTGLKDDIREQKELRALITQQIAEIRQSALSEKAKQAAIRELKAERDRTTDAIKDLRQADQEARAAARAERLEAQEAFAQSVFDLTGNKNPLLKSIQAQIKIAITARNAAKKGTTEWLKAQTEINNLLKQRKDLLETETEDETGGTSLVDLFNQAQDILGGAGNVGFSASGLGNLSARPRIQMEVQERLDIVNDPAAARAAKQQQSTDRLIAAIDQLTNAITGNSTTGGVTQGPQNRSFRKTLSEEQRFYLQRQAKQMVESGLVG